MSKFTSAKRINTRWRNNDFIGEPGSSHTFPDAFHEEFLVDWAYQIQIGDITITETPTTGNIQMSTLTVGDIVVTGTATGNFGSQATVVQGTAPISVSTSSNTATVSLNANYSTSTHTHTSFANNLQINKADSKVQLLNTTSGSGTEDGMYLLMADTDVGYLWNAETNGALVFGTGGAERVHITPAGKFGIGTSTPAHQLEVVGPASVTVGLSAGGAGFAELELVGQAGKNYITSDDTLSFDIGGTERATVAATGLDVTSGTLSQGGTAVSLSTHTHAYQPAGTYVTAVNGTAPITASTDTAGIVTVGLSASYASSVHTHATSSITSGNFVATLAAGTGVTVTGADANAAAKTVSIGQAVATSSNVSFNNVDINGANSLWVSRASVASAAQSLTNNTSTTVLLDTASTTATTGTYDPKSWFNNANDRIAIGQDGFYAVSANIAFAANATGRRTLTIAVNGADAGSVNVLAAPAGSTILSVSTNLYLSSGDLVTMACLQASGGALNTVVVAGVYPALSVGRIGA